MIPSQRKAFAGARVMFRKETKAKVYQVTGYVTKKMLYQHGDTSMNETIITEINAIKPFCVLIFLKILKNAHRFHRSLK